MSIAAVNASSIEDYNANLFANTRKPSDTLDQNDFMKLLVTQLQNQDPSSPMSNNDFAQQVTSFSSLQASQSMQTDMSWLRSSSLIGSEVDLMPSNTTDVNAMIHGVVTGVTLVDGVPQLVVDDGKTETIHKLSELRNVSPQSPVAQAN